MKHKLTDEIPPTSGRRTTLRISPEQLGDLRDGHLVDLERDIGGGVELALGDLSEMQIEALAGGRPVDLRLAVDGEAILARIIPTGPPVRRASA
jgi:hypothetical protein